MKFCLALAFLLCALSCSAARPTLQITSPANGAIVNPGQSLTVKVKARGLAKYKMMVIIGQDPIGYSQTLTSAPWEFRMLIPSDIPSGTYTLTASGAIALGQGTNSERIVIDVERSDRPVSLDIYPSTLRLSPGDLMPLQVTGTYRDGSKAKLTKLTQTSYSSQAPSVATVTNEGIITAVAPGSADIVVYGTFRVPVVVEGPIRVEPSGLSLYASEMELFIVIFRDTGDPSVKWSTDIGSISDTGMYTAPETITKRQTATVTATSVSDHNLSAAVKVTLEPGVSVDLRPLSVMVRPSQTRQFTAKVINAADRRVTWSIRPPAGSISESGLYTAPSSIASVQNLTLTVTSVIDKTKSASATITLVPPR